MVFRTVRYVAAAAVVTAVAIVCAASNASAEWTKVYSEDWSNGSGGWSTAQSSLPGKHSPTRLYVGNPLAQYVIWFNGHDGWGLRASSIPKVKMKLVTRVYMKGSQRNAISVNVRNRGGGMVYKYGMGGDNYVIANCQGGADQPVNLGGLRYQLNTPYDLISLYDGGGFYVGLKNLLTGEEKWSGRRNNLKSGATPATIDIDQEGGYGPAGLGLVEVWLDM